MLVLSQSRLRPYSDTSLLHQAAISAPNFDWSEAAARFFLRQRVQSSSSSMTTPQGQAIHDPKEHMSFSSGSQRLVRSPLHHETLPRAHQRHYHDNLHPTVSTSEPQTQAFHDPLHSTPFSAHQRHLQEPIHLTSFNSEPRTQALQDPLHFIPFSAHQRHRHDHLHLTSFNSEPQTQAFHETPHSTPFSSTHQRHIHDPFYPTPSSEPWWWDSGLPLNLAGHQECEELYRLGLTAHPAFSSTMLACHDPHHAGTVTNTDLVTMVLNLLCNSVLELDQRYCCS